MKLVIVVSALMLAACQPYAKQETYPVLPVELQDCKFYRVSDGNTYITIARCPNSSIAVKTHSKSPKTTITIDGQEYVSRP